jgi:uncharacterized circularly permuted ATP-grasp superfamily protein
MNFANYEVASFYDEFLTDAKVALPGATNLMHSIQSLPQGEFARRQAAAERVLMQMGITFNVYGEQAGVEKIFPFDIVPRIVSAAEWSRLEKGLKQRIHALNLFIDDLYHEQRILNDGVVPREIILSAKSYRKQCIGWKPPRGIWCHITGTDLVRHSDGQIYVLEDNLRCPSGVSYVLQNRQVMKSLFPKAFAASKDAPGAGLPAQASRHAGVSGAGSDRPAARCAADTGHLQLRLLRALLPRATDGRGSCGRPGPGGRR